MINEIISVNNGSKFFKVDLHIHPPASQCYGPKELCKSDREIKANEIVNKALEKKLEIIAITDHNSEGMYKEISLLKKESKEIHLRKIEDILKKNNNKFKEPKLVRSIGPLWVDFEKRKYLVERDEVNEIIDNLEKKKLS